MAELTDTWPPRRIGSFFKGDPRKVEQVERKLSKAAADKAGKAAVKARDKGVCRICGRKATEVHEALKFKSLGGVASLENSIQVCAEPKGRCHQLCQQHGVRVIGTHCSEPLIFEMREAVKLLIFRHRPVPNHVRIVEK